MTTGIKNKLATVKEEVRTAYQNGATLKEIAVAHGVSQGTVRNCLIGMGVDLRSRGRRKKQDQPNPQLLPLEDDVVEDSPVNF